MRSISTKKHISYVLMCFVFLGCQSKPTSTTFFPKDTIDLGAVSSGDSIDFVVDVKNPTDNEAKVADIRGTCGCIKVKNYPAVLKASEAGTINATYYSKFDKKSAGPLYKSIVLRSDKKPFIHAIQVKVNVE
ncbi:DUF1573 domain-containing protein [Fibrella sp. USSR17]